MIFQRTIQKNVIFNTFDGFQIMFKGAFRLNMIYTIKSKNTIHTDIQHPYDPFIWLFKIIVVVTQHHSDILILNHGILFRFPSILSINDFQIL